MEDQKKMRVKGVFSSKVVRLIVVTAAIVLLCIVFVAAGSSRESQEANFIVQGNLKTDETNLNSKLAGTIEQVLVSEGDTVKAGDPMIVLNSETVLAKKQQMNAKLAEAQGQVAAAEAAEAAANAQYQKALNGARSQDVAQAKASNDLAEKTYNRMKGLYEQGAIPEASFDQASTQYQVAKETYDMALQGTREEDKLAAQAQVAQAASAAASAKGMVLEAQGAIAEVDSYLVDSVIKAPQDGVVTAVNVNAGELVSTGMPLATVSSSEKPWVELNVKETELSMVKTGAKVQVHFVAYPDETFEGIVTRVNEKPDFATKRATNNNGEFDVLSYGVKVEITGVGHELYPGMTVTVDFGKKAGA